MSNNNDKPAKPVPSAQIYTPPKKPARPATLTVRSGVAISESSKKPTQDKG
ncbi:MAG: hypothetical protein HQL80_12735 [Magnetococcales bacterium]|nr:hypothetical protein [Magnetococcales bacterium]